MLRDETARSCFVLKDTSSHKSLNLLRCQGPSSLVLVHLKLRTNRYLKVGVLPELGG